MGIVGAFLPYPILMAGGTFSVFCLLLPLWASIGYLKLGSIMNRSRGAALNNVLKHTSVLMLMYTLLNTLMMVCAPL